MRLEKAIEILTQLQAYPITAYTGKDIQALRLGIEALRKWQVLREGRAGVIDPLLPGETES